MPYTRPDRPPRENADRLNGPRKLLGHDTIPLKNAQLAIGQSHRKVDDNLIHWLTQETKNVFAKAFFDRIVPGKG